MLDVMLDQNIRCEHMVKIGFILVYLFIIIVFESNPKKETIKCNEILPHKVKCGVVHKPNLLVYSERAEGAK